MEFELWLIVDSIPQFLYFYERIFEADIILKLFQTTK